MLTNNKNENGKKKIGAVIRTANLPNLVFDEHGNLDLLASQEALVSTLPCSEALEKVVIVEPSGVKTIGISELMRADAAEIREDNAAHSQPIP
jgi:hypothetical protein